MFRRPLACAAAALAAASVSLTGCTTNPATGEQILALLSPQEEAALGAEAAPEFTKQYGGEVPSEALQRYVQDIGMKMAQRTESYFPELEWEFTLLNTDVINAFALPGGKVFFTRGLAERLTSEAQMAGVLGHEIGHVTAQHGNQRISQSQLFNAAVAGAAIAVGVADEDSDFRKYGQYGVPALAVGGNVLLLKYGRDQESQADSLGMRYMAEVGYDPHAQLEVMQILAQASGDERPIEWLSTHPHPETRVDRIRSLLQTEYASTQGNPDYKTYEDRYQNEFLSVIRKLSPAPKASAAIGEQHRLLENPSLWCARCASGRSILPVRNPSDALDYHRQAAWVGALEQPSAAASR